MDYKVRFVGDKLLTVEDVDMVDYNTRAKVVLFLREVAPSKYDLVVGVSLYNMLYYEPVTNI